MIQVINRALDIIELLAKEPQQAKSLSEIAESVSVQPSTCANIIKTLTGRGYIRKMDNQKGYLIGDKLQHLFENGFQEKLIEKSKIELEYLTQKLNENTSLAILEGNTRKVILKVISDQQIQAQTPDIKNTYDTSTGRVLLAMESDDFLKQYLQKYGLPEKGLWNEIVDEKTFFDEIGKIREQGYALIEDSVQVIGFSAPIYSKDKSVAALSIYMPAFRYSESLRKTLIELGLKTTKKISGLL